ncbi:spermidine/putrescine transport system substrate-binding protein [Palleronia aestuarii]|uniref:Spermidine/putrescine transport system substrate-binding protein n=1 Tax=Palleronia aestuarii TaxID=568105 RepID=A0A2W7N5T4_9RHOB|nr:extracellular solute-binding protein [Palleronia aestuarii]PZX13637.1 spermidine/putrescine transport system substrate-binding protein [Palleronia aestuarii]
MTRPLFALALLAAGPAMAQDDSLLVFDYSGFEDPNFHQPYVEAHGQGPDFSFFGDEQEAFQKLRSGFRADVAHICAGSVSTWAESGLLEPWDTSRIDAWENINRDLVGEDVTDDTEEVLFVPTDYGSTAIAYNTDTVPAEDVASLSVFENPEYAGAMTLPDNVDDAYALAYLATGTTDWGSVTDAQFEAASDWLRNVHENLRTYWTDPAELAQLLASGEVQIAWAWNETLPTLAEEGFPIGFARETEEGSSLWLCGYVNLADGDGSEDLAYDYLNAILAPVSAEPLMESGFGSANEAGMQQMGEDVLVASGLGAIDVPVFAQLPLDVELRERQSAEFERIKAGF